MNLCMARHFDDSNKIGNCTFLCEFRFGFMHKNALRILTILLFCVSLGSYIFYRMKLFFWGKGGGGAVWHP